MFLDRKFGYTESQDYTQLPGFEKLSADQQKRVHGAFDMGYMSAKHMGIKIALGTGHATAKAALEEELNSKTTTTSDVDVPPSIFAGLDNCY